MPTLIQIVTIIGLAFGVCTGQLDNSIDSSSQRVAKCQAYSEYIYTTVTIPAFHSNSNPIIVRKNRCGQNSAPFIVGGVEALPREHPYSALIGYQNGSGIVWGCGGSLVSSRYILTAGHCLESSEFGPIIKVRLGELNYTSDSDDATPKDFDVEELIPYPEYTPLSRYNDIALIKLSEQVQLSPYIRPICLPESNIESKEYIATGWGYTSYSGQLNDTLLKVQLEPFAEDVCKKVYLPFISRKLRSGVVSTQICAGHTTKERDTCNGDSGGPLLIYHPNVTCSSIQLGVTSFSSSCGVINFPAVYTRVYLYADWIESVIWAPGEDF